MKISPLEYHSHPKEYPWNPFSLGSAIPPNPLYDRLQQKQQRRQKTFSIDNGSREWKPFLNNFLQPLTIYSWSDGFTIYVGMEVIWEHGWVVTPNRHSTDLTGSHANCRQLRDGSVLIKQVIAVNRSFGISGAECMAIKHLYCRDFNNNNTNIIAALSFRAFPASKDRTIGAN